MASMAHEVLVDLFKNRPSPGAELLSEALGVALPSYTEARLISIDLRRLDKITFQLLEILCPFQPADRLRAASNGI
jgi:hypothetical protein